MNNAFSSPAPSRSLWPSVIAVARKARRAPLLPSLVMLLMIAAALLPQLFTAQDPYRMVMTDRLQPPIWQGGSPAHPLGTDDLGRDLLARVVYGTRFSLAVALLSLALGGFIGTVVGLASGYYGGRVDSVLMRITDTTLAFPMIFLALLLAVIQGPSFFNVVIAIGLVLWARYARVIRGEVLSLKEQDFVSAARVAGCSSLRIIVVHLFPNVFNSLVVMLTLQVGWVIVTEASLSFLGAGIPQPTPAWGSMVAAGQDYIGSCWWIGTLPGIAILMTVLAFNLFGDWLRDTLDPRLRQV